MSDVIDMVQLAKDILYPMENLAEERKNPVTRSATRGDWQQAIENNIVWFSGDALEVHDILGAFKKSLADRYGDQAEDVQQALADLQGALVELDGTT